MTAEERENTAVSERSDDKDQERSDKARQSGLHKRTPKRSGKYGLEGRNLVLKDREETSEEITHNKSIKIRQGRAGEIRQTYLRYKKVKHK